MDLPPGHALRTDLANAKAKLEEMLEEFLFSIKSNTLRFENHKRTSLYHIYEYIYT
jgi:hypothetical protein